jgi:hypothetical protein
MKANSDEYVKLQDYDESSDDDDDDAADDGD